MPSWVYILRCSDGSYYTGVTSNIERRLDQHYHGEIGYTASRKPFEFLWSDEFAHIDDAIAFEKKVKGWSRAKKEALMRGDWTDVQRLAKSKEERSVALRQAQGDATLGIAPMLQWRHAELVGARRRSD